MRVNCVMLGLENPFWSTQCNNLVSRFFNIIDTKACTDNFKSSFFEPEPHITLACGLVENPGPNSMYVFLKLIQRELYSRLKSDTALILDNPVINWFKNPDYYVLKLDLSECSKFDIFKDYRDALISKFGIETDYPDYKPHITITYLDKNLSEEDLKLIVDSIDKTKLSKFVINRFMVSDGSNSKDTNERITRDFFIG